MQNLVYIKTLVMQQVIASPLCGEGLTATDLHALTTLVWEHTNPDGASSSIGKPGSISVQMPHDDTTVARTPRMALIRSSGLSLLSNSTAPHATSVPVRRVRRSLQLQMIFICAQCALVVFPD